MENARKPGQGIPGNDGNGSRKVVTFGEAMVRLTPPAHERLERAVSLEVTAGGAELNAAVGLVCLGFDATWVSILPETAPGRLIGRLARAHGVDIAPVKWVHEDEGRTGLYFLEEGLEPRPSTVTYDRKDSAIARMTGGAFDWDELLRDAAAFHMSGITLALSPAVRAEAMAAVQAANQLGVTVSFDLNYRSKLWSEAEAREAFVEIIPHVDVLFASQEALLTFYGIEGSPEDALRNAIRKLGVTTVTITHKEPEGSRRMKLSGMAMGKDVVLATSSTRTIEVLDRLGGGDAYAAGFLAGHIEDPGALTRAVSLGVATSALKHTMRGDFLCATRHEIEAAMDTSREGVLQR